MKKIISLLLCAVMLCTQMPLGASAATSDQDAQMVIRALGIMVGDASGDMKLGNNVTRAEFAKMLIAASPYKDAVQPGATASSYSDVASSHWAAGYIRLAAQNGWMTGYSDGTFRPSGQITYEEGASAVLKLLGYQPADLTGSYPAAQLSKFKALSLDDGIKLSQGQIMTRENCMHVFYNLMSAKNKEGKVYGTELGYVVASNGQIDYAKIVQSDMKGPYVTQDKTAAQIVPFALESATIYRNGIASTAEAIQQFDVVYYNENVTTVWVYSDRVVGTYSAATPSAATPDAVTVAGVSYTISGASARHKLSTAGEYKIGDVVTLLLGMDGSVVDVISGNVTNMIYYGMITESTLSTINQSASSSVAQYVVRVMCTDGISRDINVSTKEKFTEGNVVSVTYEKGEATVTVLANKSISGTVSKNATMLGDYDFAPDVKIMDVGKYEQYAFMHASRLAGYTLDSKDVRFYTLNAANQISHLILDNATGDPYQYALMFATEKNNTGSYTYYLNGKQIKLNSSTMYSVKTGAVLLYNNAAGELQGMKNLSSAKLTEYSTASAKSDNRTFKIAENVQVYIESNGEYHLTNANTITASEYSLTGYYADEYRAGNMIRVILAVKK